MTRRHSTPGDIDPQPFTDPATGFTGWRLRLHSHRGIPTPAVHDGRVFVGGGFGNYDFYALDAHTGHLAWHFRTGDDGPTAAVVADGRAVFNTESCTLEVVDIASGALIWDRWLGDPLLGQPAVHGGKVFMVYPARGTHHLGAFSLQDGEPLWAVPLEHDVITAPVAVDDKVYLSTLDGSVRAVQAETGEVIWSKQMQATSAPWIYEGEVYVSHKERSQTREEKSTTETRKPPDDAPRERTSKFHAGSGDARSAFAAKDAPYLSENWGFDYKSSFLHDDADVGFAQAPGAAKLDISSSLIGETTVSRTWRYQGSRPVVVDGVLYDTTGDCLEARDPHSGDVKWRWVDAESRPGERRLTPPAVANGRIWAGTWDGRLISWDATTGDVRWAVDVGAPCHWQTAISDGTVCAALEDGTLVVLRTEDPLDTDWPMWGGGAGHNGEVSLMSEPMTSKPDVVG
jgi:outer membrane protein assembly factor BamB